MSNKITVSQKKNHRVGVFVDVQNMYHSAKNLYGARVNFQELLRVEVARHQDVLVTQSHEHTLEGQVNQTSGADSIAAPGKIF